MYWSIDYSFFLESGKQRVFWLGRLLVILCWAENDHRDQSWDIMTFINQKRKVIGAQCVCVLCSSSSSKSNTVEPESRGGNIMAAEVSLIEWRRRVLLNLPVVILFEGSNDCNEYRTSVIIYDSRELLLSQELPVTNTRLEQDQSIRDQNNKKTKIVNKAYPQL